MRNRLLRKIMAITLAAGILVTAGCVNSGDSVAGQEDSSNTADGGQVSAAAEDMFTDRDMSGDYDEKVVDVVLSDGACSSKDDSVTVDGDSLKITSKGTYVVSGSLSDGMIIVDADDSDKVQLVLNGVDITSKTSAPIYVKNAKKVFVTLAAGTDNILTNGGSYEQFDDNNIDAVIFAKDDITLNGEGSLTINASNGHGVVGKDDIAITSGTYNITSDSHSFDGKNSVRVAGGTFTLKTGKDGLHAENADDTSLGFVYVSGGDFTIAAASDGMSAAAELKIDGGNISITESEEGLEGKDILINDGDIQIVASDDGINASDGSSQADGGMAEAGRRPEPGDMAGNGQVPDSGEMTEGDRQDNRNASGDDQVPDNGQMPDNMRRPERGEHPEGMNGKRKGGPGGGGFDVQDASIVINGGTITIDAEGDGIDSNGTLTINGGSVYVAGSTQGGNGALDYGKDAVITGGTVIAVGDAGMAETFGEESTQKHIMVNVEDQPDGGDIILKDQNGDAIVSWNTTKRFNSLVISCPKLQAGKTYTLVTGDTSKEVTTD